MTAESRDPGETARKGLALIFQRLASVGQATVAERTGLSESTVSRWKTEQFEQALRILAELGIKIVPSHARCYEPKQIEAILALAKARLSQIETTEQLQWDEPE